MIHESLVLHCLGTVDGWGSTSAPIAAGCEPLLSSTFQDLQCADGGAMATHSKMSAEKKKVHNNH